jgi:hypothetical protein
MLLRIMFALCLTSCSVNYHLNKAIKKGYRCDTIADTIRITKVDSFLIVKHDTTYWVKVVTSKDTIIHYKTSYIPKTRYETRFEYKRFNDSLRTIRLMYKDSLRSALKSAKNDLKRERVVQRNKPLRQFKQLFVILGFILTLFFVFILLKKRLL